MRVDRENDWLELEVKTAYSVGSLNLLRLIGDTEHRFHRGCKLLLRRCRGRARRHKNTFRYRRMYKAI